MPPWQRERLCRWQQEWEIHLALGNATRNAHDTQSEPADDRPVRAEDVAAAPFDEASEFFQQGAIRLAPDDWCGGTRVAVEFLVLGQWGEDRDSRLWMIAPYGPMSEPADPSELKTGREDVGKRVLCLWNARIVPEEILKRSWFIEQAEPEEVEDALAVWDSFALGMDLSLHLRCLVGPPVWDNRSDTRHAYFTEESRAIAGLDSVLFGEAEDDKPITETPKRAEAAVSLLEDLPRRILTPRMGRLEQNADLALAAGEKTLPEQMDVSELLPGFAGFARGSVRKPNEATVLTFFCGTEDNSDQPPPIVATWPGGASRSCSFAKDFSDWVAEIEIDVPWNSAVELLEGGKLAVALQY